MCMICVDFNLGKLTIDEAYRNLKEVFKDEDEHTLEVWLKLVEKEMESG